MLPTADELCDSYGTKKRAYVIKQKHPPTAWVPFCCYIWLYVNCRKEKTKLTSQYSPAHLHHTAKSEVAEEEVNREGGGMGDYNGKHV